MKRSLFLMGIVACLSLSAGLRGAAEPMSVEVTESVLTADMIETANDIVQAIIINLPEHVEIRLNQFFEGHENPAVALMVADALLNFVRAELDKQNNLDCLQNAAGMKFAEILTFKINESVDNVQAAPAMDEATEEQDDMFQDALEEFPAEQADQNQAEPVLPPAHLPADMEAYMYYLLGWTNDESALQ